MTQVLAGLVLVLLSLVCWGGQSLSWLAPQTAARWSLTDREEDVDRAFWADGRGEAAWDALSLWTLLVAGLLLIADVAAWAYFGLVGGGMYVYFAGRGVAARILMQRHGVRIGTKSDVQTAFVALVVWGIAGLATIAAAVSSLGS